MTASSRRAAIARRACMTDACRRSRRSSARRNNMSGSLGLALRLARRELRGGLKGFRVFVACLMLGVAAIAAVGSLASGVTTALLADARVLLGGDVELSYTHREATPAQLAHLNASGRLSAVAEMRAMARTAD